MKNKSIGFYWFIILICFVLVAGIAYWLYKGVDNFNIIAGLVMTGIMFLFLIRLAVAEANDIRNKDKVGIN